MDMGDNEGGSRGGKDEQREVEGGGDLGRREKEKSLLEKQQTSTSGVNTHAVANTGASEKRWWSSIDKLLLGGDAEGGEEEEAPSTREEYSE